MFPVALLTAVCVLGAAPDTRNWPDYRGPLGTGHSSATGLATEWSETKNVKWKTPIHGKGWSTPVIWNKQAWLTTATRDGKEQFVVCVDVDSGKILLDQLLFANPEPESISDVNSYASPSPVIEEGRVYVHFGTYGTACFDTKSLKKVWERRDLHCRHSVGPGSSPILFRNLLILTFDGIDTQFVTALDKRTGVTQWTTERSALKKYQGPNPEAPMAKEMLKSFATPFIMQNGMEAELLSIGAQAIYGYDPLNGRERWRCQFVNGYSNSPRPIVLKDKVFVTTGYDKANLIAVKLGGTGDVTATNLLWKVTKNVPFKPNLILVEGLLYMADDSGVISCVEAETGNLVWRERLEGNYSASPIYSESKIYFFNEQGKSTIIAPGRTFKVLAENQLTDGFMASAAVTGKAMILRTKTALYRIER